MFDIVTFGSATGDVFLKLNRSNYKVRDKALCFDLGAKVLVDNTAIFSGGGGTNTACALSNLGFKTAYVGVVGNDAMADVVLNDLKKFGVYSGFVKTDFERKTSLSAILSTNRERTILIKKGASHFLEKKDIPFSRIKKAKWFYIAPLYHKTGELLPEIVQFARENRISIALNPSVEFVKKQTQETKSVLALVDILILNKTEACLLSNCKAEETDFEILKELKYLCPGIIVITKGRKGVLACDGRIIFKAKTSSTVRIKEKTGAGDAFGCGFVAGLLEKNSIEYGIQLGIANSESCIQQIGAKNGLLQKRKRKGIIKNYKITTSNL